MRWLAYGAALLSTLVWGTGFVATKLMLDQLRSPLVVLILRFGLSAVVNFLLLAAVQRGRPVLPTRARGRLLFVALAGPVLNSLGVTVAINYIGAGTSSLVIMLVPALTGVLAILTGQERFSARKLQGFVVALAGLLVVVLLGGSGAGLAGAQVVGLVFLLAGALGFAVYNVYSRPLFADYSAIEVSAYVGIVAGLGLLPLLAYEPIRADFAAVERLTAGGWLLLAYLGLLANVAVFLLWYFALGQLGATRVGLLTYFIPVWGLASSALLLQEQLTAWLPVGVALVVVGIVIANRSPHPR